MKKNDIILDIDEGQDTQPTRKAVTQIFIIFLHCNIAFTILFVNCPMIIRKRESKAIVVFFITSSTAGIIIYTCLMNRKAFDWFYNVLREWAYVEMFSGL